MKNRRRRKQSASRDKRSCLHDFLYQNKKFNGFLKCFSETRRNKICRTILVKNLTVKLVNFIPDFKL